MMPGKCYRLEYVEIDCDLIPDGKIIECGNGNIVPMTNECLACMIDNAHKDLSHILLGIEKKLGMKPR